MIETLKRRLMGEETMHSSPVPSYVPPISSKPKPTYLKLMKSNIPESYEEIAASIGYAPKFLKQEKVKMELFNFLASHNIPVFDRKAVTMYMDQAIIKLNKDRDEYHKLRWTWVPLRHKDDKTHLTYNKAIPIEILRQIKLIHDEFGERARFFVTDYEVVKPDPFIKVEIDYIQEAIFGVWDEPGFGI